MNPFYVSLVLKREDYSRTDDCGEYKPDKVFGMVVMFAESEHAAELELVRKYRQLQYEKGEDITNVMSYIDGRCIKSFHNNSVRLNESHERGELGLCCYDYPPCVNRTDNQHDELGDQHDELGNKYDELGDQRYEMDIPSRCYPNISIEDTTIAYEFLRRTGYVQNSNMECWEPVTLDLPEGLEVPERPDETDIPDEMYLRIFKLFGFLKVVEYRLGDLCDIDSVWSKQHFPPRKEPKGARK